MSIVGKVSGGVLEVAAPVPAVGAQFFLGQSDGLNEVAQSLVFEAGQLQLLADEINRASPKT